jgi:hypothetical protein
MALEGTERVVTKPYLRDGFASRDATFSPDGRWLAYSSNESGTQHVFVRSFPDPNLEKYPSPRWRQHCVAHRRRELDGRPEEVSAIVDARQQCRLLFM